MVPNPCGPSRAAGSPDTAKGVRAAAGDEKLPVALRSMPRRLEAKSSATSRAYAAFSACGSDLPLSCMGAAYKVPILFCHAKKEEDVRSAAQDSHAADLCDELLEVPDSFASLRGEMQDSVARRQQCAVYLIAKALAT